ncbi:MAG: thioredoxin family protein [Planctomycetia bacterium]|nr:thioredoxin family protein [Planctomycetia bacterium]
MRQLSAALIAAILLLVAGVNTSTAAGTPTLADALKQASKDGRPVLALCTRATCPLCAAFKKRLATDPALASLVPNYVVLNVNVDKDAATMGELGKLKQLDGKLPFVYVVSADGKLGAAARDANSDPNVPGMLRQGLAHTGKLLQPNERAKLEATLTKAKAAIERDDIGQAVSLLAPATKMSGQADVLVDSRKVLADLNEKAASDIAECEKALTDQDTLAAAVLIASASRRYARLPEQRKPLAEVLKKVKAAEDGRAIYNQAEEIIRARGYAQSHKSQRAAQAFQEIIKKYPDTPVARLASKELESLGAETEKKEAVTK